MIPTMFQDSHFAAMKMRRLVRHVLIDIEEGILLILPSAMDIGTMLDLSVFAGETVDEIEAFMDQNEEFVD